MELSRPAFRFCVVLTAIIVAANALSQLSVPATNDLSLELEDATLIEVLSAARRTTPFNVIIDGGQERRSSFKFRGSLDAFLTDAGNVYDYHWTRVKDNTILMRKRFRSESSRPQAIRAELQDSTARMIEALRHLPANLSRPITFAFRDLYLSLSHIELSQLRAGHKINLRDLTPAARQFAEEAVLLDCFDRTAEALVGLHALLSDLEKGKLSHRSESVRVPQFSATYSDVVLRIPLINGRASETVVARRPMGETN